MICIPPHTVDYEYMVDMVFVSCVLLVIYISWYAIRLVMMLQHRSTSSTSSSSTSDIILGLDQCRGLVTLHWSGVRAGLSRGDLCCLGGQSMSATRCLASQARLSCRSEHTFSSHVNCRMKVVKTFVRERVMLPIGTASYLM